MKTEGKFKRCNCNFCCDLAVEIPHSATMSFDLTNDTGLTIEEWRATVHNLASGHLVWRKHFYLSYFYVMDAIK
jgi:hypothetical protein